MFRNYWHNISLWEWRAPLQFRARRDFSSEIAIRTHTHTHIPIYIYIYILLHCSHSYDWPNSMGGTVESDSIHFPNAMQKPSKFASKKIDPLSICSYNGRLYKLSVSQHHEAQKRICIERPNEKYYSEKSMPTSSIHYEQLQRMLDERKSEKHTQSVSRTHPHPAPSNANSIALNMCRATKK